MLKMIIEQEGKWYRVSVENGVQDFELFANVDSVDDSLTAAIDTLLGVALNIMRESDAGITLNIEMEGEQT